MSKAVAIAASASAARRVRWVMIGMLMTLLAALSLSAWCAAGAVAAWQRGPAWPPRSGEHGPDGRHARLGRAPRHGRQCTTAWTAA